MSEKENDFVQHKGGVKTAGKRIIIRTARGQGRKYVMRKIISVREGWINTLWFKLECGHEENKTPHPTTAMALFCLDQKIPHSFGCFTCGKELYEKSFSSPFMDTRKRINNLPTGGGDKGTVSRAKLKGSSAVFP